MQGQADAWSKVTDSASRERKIVSHLADVDRLAVELFARRFRPLDEVRSVIYPPQFLL